MNSSDFCINHPIGRHVTQVDVQQQFASVTGWEDRYRLLIKLGQTLPAFLPQWQDDQNQILGCDSAAWILAVIDENGCHFAVQSPSRIVCGLLVVLLAALNHQHANFILHFDVKHYLESLGLANHLNDSRVNGLQATYQQICAYVKSGGIL